MCVFDHIHSEAQGKLRAGGRMVSQASAALGTWGEELALVYTASRACRFHIIKWVSLEGWLDLERLALPLDYHGEKNLPLLVLTSPFPIASKSKSSKQC